MPEKRNADKSERKEIQAQIRQLEVSQFHFGPLPPPEQLSKYNEAVSNGAERILIIAEKQAAHRQSLEAKVIDGDIKRSYWGLAAGFSVSVLALSASTFLIYNGHDVAGASIFGASLRKKERERKLLPPQPSQ